MNNETQTPNENPLSAEEYADFIRDLSVFMLVSEIKKQFPEKFSQFSEELKEKGIVTYKMLYDDTATDLFWHIGEDVTLLLCPASVKESFSINMGLKEPADD